MKTPEFTIPSSFHRQDTRTNSADSFANVAEQQRKRLNHNILLARRTRKVVFSQQFKSDYAAATFQSISGENVLKGTKIVSFSWRPSPKVKEIVVVMRAKKLSSANVNLWLYTVQERDGNPGMSFAASIVVDSSSYQKETIKVPIAKMNRFLGDPTVRLCVVMGGFLEGSALLTTSLPVTGAGMNYLEGDIGTSYVGKAVYISTDNNIVPRKIVRYQADIDAGGHDRIYVYPPWNSVPSPGSDAFNIKGAASIDIESLTAYEEALTSFNTETATQQLGHG